MTHNEFDHIMQNLEALSPEQLQHLRRQLDVRLSSIEANPSDRQDPGSIGAMRDDAEFLDRIVEDAMRDRREQPWRLAPGE